MSSLSEIYIKKETIDIIAATLAKKTGEDAKGVKITISLNDESNDYGQNVSAFIAQTKEQREAKEKPYYIGNGKVFWTKGETPIGKKKEATTETNTTTGSSDINPLGTKLPF